MSEGETRTSHVDKGTTYCSVGPVAVVEAEYLFAVPALLAVSPIVEDTLMKITENNTSKTFACSNICSYSPVQLLRYADLSYFLHY